MTSDARSRPAVQATGLGKRYQLGERSRLGSGLTRRLRGERSSALKPFEALHNVSFTVERGECFGIVGTNGSGKSTILQILSRTIVPTTGSMLVRGRVLALLAVGAGFHLDLTGRENVVLLGAILGIRRNDVMLRMDDILAFAELELHADTPLKRYSDGMKSRLSFAIAMRFPADIYIFDEVLAVVDGEFRQRCVAEVERLVGSGPTVLFVSHDLEQSEKLCGRTMWLHQGNVQSVGETEEVLARYREHMRSHAGR